MKTIAAFVALVLVILIGAGTAQAVTSRETPTQVVSQEQYDNALQGINELSRGHKELQYAVWMLALRVDYVWAEFDAHRTYCGTQPTASINLKALTEHAE
jgi:hypothetical protein